MIWQRKCQNSSIRDTVRELYQSLVGARTNLDLESTEFAVQQNFTPRHHFHMSSSTTPNKPMGVFHILVDVCVRLDANSRDFSPELETGRRQWNATNDNSHSVVTILTAVASLTLTCV